MAPASASARRSRTNLLLTNLAKWLILNSKASAIALIALAASTAVGFGGWGLEHLQVRYLQTTNTNLSITIGSQRQQLEQLAADSAQRVADARIAGAAAQKRADAKNAQAKSLLGAKPSNPKDLCQSADELIRQELTETLH